MIAQTHDPVEYALPRKVQMGLILDTHIRAALEREAAMRAEDMSQVARTILRQYFGLDQRNGNRTNSLGT